MARSWGVALDEIVHVCATILALVTGLVGILAAPTVAQIDVWIDPGHDGHDPGALGVNGAALPNEKELNIGVANYLESEPAGLGYYVYKTQNSSDACQFGHTASSGNQATIADGIAAGVSHYLGALLESPLPREIKPPIAVISGPTMHAIVASLQEDFEGTAFPPTGWTIQTAGLGIPYAWHRTTDTLYVGSGTGSALVGGESPSAIDEWLISPGVSLARTDRAIKFSWSGSQMWSNVLNASLSIRTAGTSVWTQLWSIANDEPPANPFIYRDRVVDLSAWTGKNVEFGFRVVGTNGADFALDDIVVGDFEPTATAPNDVCTNATALNDVFSIQGVTCYAANDSNMSTQQVASCVGDELDGPDVFYEIVAVSGDSLHAAVTAEWGAGLYLVTDCVNPVCLAGGSAEDDRTAPIVDYKFSTAGTYYLVVDGEEGSCGPYQLAGEIIRAATE